MQTNKKIKILSNFETNKTKGANAFFEGLDGQTTFGQLKQIADLLIKKDSLKTKYGLYYNNVEMNLNDDKATIDEIFEAETDIVIEIGPKSVLDKVESADKPKKPNNSDRSNKISSYENEDNNKNYVFSCCDTHKIETAQYFCENCSESICFRCSIHKKHKNHNLQEKLMFYNNKFNSVNERYKSIKLDIENNHLINKFKDIKSNHLLEIEEDFKLLILKLEEIKSYYLNFFEDYYKVLENNITKVVKQYESNHNEINDIQNTFSMNEQNFRNNLSKIETLQSSFNILFKDNIKLNDLHSLNSDFDFCCKENINNLNYLIEKINLGGYFNEELINEYEKLSYDKLSNIGKLDELSGNLGKYSKLCNKEIIAAFEEIITTSDQIQDQILMPVPTSNKVLAYYFTQNEFKLNEIGKDKDKNKLLCIDIQPNKNSNDNDILYKPFAFYDFARYFNVGNWLIVTGGVKKIILEDEDNLDNEVAYVFLYDFNANTIHQLESMKTPHSVHMLFYLNPKLLFAVSGKANKDLEVYSLQKRIWSKFKPLSKERCNANVLNYNNKFLYVFGGSDSKSYFGSSFERIHISDLFNDSLVTSYFQKNYENYNYSFECGNLNLGEKVNLLFTGFGIIELGDDNNSAKNYLILGGYNSTSENEYLLNNEVRTAEYKTSNNSNNFTVINSNLKLKSNSCFYYQTFVKVTEQKLALFNASGELIIYKIDKSEFDVIKHDLIL